MAEIRGLAINSAGARALLRSPEVEADLMRRAEAIRRAADAVGSGAYEASSSVGTGRARASVSTTDALSRASNAKHNTLASSLDAGRGRP